MDSADVHICVERIMKTMSIVEKYERLISEYGFTKLNNPVNVNYLIREAIDSYLPYCKRPAIWCYGEHTKMLMADFMNELKTVKYIIDERADDYRESSGFNVIGKEDIEKEGIDGVIISSYKFREEIKGILARDYPDLSYLDLYDYIKTRGICIDREYYAVLHPYSRYQGINNLRLQLKDGRDCQEETYVKLIGCLVEIKDFCTAITFSEELYRSFPNPKYKSLMNDLRAIYDLECRLAGEISEDNVLMLCIDGLRDKDISERDMPNFTAFSKECYRFERAYSVSTSTYESLVPAYSENMDMRTKYYEKNCAAEGECRFIQKAEEQERKIVFYTDFVKYVEGRTIRRVEAYQTATEKLWNFILDAGGEKNGLFYIHILYESHYSYPNPYIESRMITSGSNILFDYMQEYGGEIRTDYEMQHRAMLNYLDDAVIPVLRRVKCRMVLFADHGNIIVDRKAKLEELDPLLFTYHQDLVRIPLIIKSSEMGTGTEKKNISLMELNTILISLLEKTRFVRRYGDLVKVQRSEIYNPDFHYIYEKRGYAQGLLAFEAFVFEEGYKLGIFSNGCTELVSVNDEQLADEDKKGGLLERIKKDITVCGVDEIVL